MYSSVDTMWVLIGALLVFFMQAGFTMVEVGFTRAKNSGNIIMKNMMDFSIGTPAFWILGFGLMFGTNIGGFIGAPDFFVQGDYSGTYPTMAFLIFQTVFCATAATIVSGAMAERTKFSSYCIYSAILSAVIYPISGHWIWGGGWLSELGFHDFAGSTAVHMVGGVAALVGAKILGPRIGKYTEDGTPRAIPGCSLSLGALGVFILWFAWFGFNGCSTVSATGDDTLVQMGTIFVTTNLCAAMAALTTMIITWLRYKKPDVSMTLNGALAGLVAITAGCDAVSPMGAFFIGIISAFFLVFSIEFIDKILKIDDPVGAVGVHGVCGALGTILTGVFAVDGGLLYGGGIHMVAVQSLGVAAVIVWVAVTMAVVFSVIKATIGLRVDIEEEIVGLDIKEHGIVTEFNEFDLSGLEQSSAAKEAVTVEYVNTTANDVNTAAGDKMTKLTIVTRKSKFDDLKAALNKIGVTGMTVMEVMGCGQQKGNSEFYRGIELEVHLIPKVQVDVVVCEVSPRLVIETAKKVLATGKIGDGKIFVYNVENVVKIRTGEEGLSALCNNK